MDHCRGAVGVGAPSSRVFCKAALHLAIGCCMLCRVRCSSVACRPVRVVCCVFAQRILSRCTIAAGHAMGFGASAPRIFNRMMGGADVAVVGVRLPLPILAAFAFACAPAWSPFRVSRACVRGSDVAA